MWTYEALETSINVIERGTCSLRKVSMSWNIPLNSLSNHLNRKTRLTKMEIGGVLIKEDIAMIKWTLDMQGCGLSISLQQLKMRIAWLAQTRDTTFRDGILGNSW
jgi:hypothetical protein